MTDPRPSKRTVQMSYGHLQSWPGYLNDEYGETIVGEDLRWADYIEMVERVHERINLAHEFGELLYKRDRELLLLAEAQRYTQNLKDNPRIVPGSYPPEQKLRWEEEYQKEIAESEKRVAGHAAKAAAIEVRLDHIRRVGRAPEEPVCDLCRNGIVHRHEVEGV